MKKTTVAASQEIDQKSADDGSEQAVADLFEKIKASLLKRDFKAATRCMTPACADQFLARKLLVAARHAGGELGADTDSETSAALAKEFGFDDVLTPSEANSEDMEAYLFGTSDLLGRLLQAVDQKADRYEAIEKITAHTETVLGPMMGTNNDYFTGEILRQEPQPGGMLVVAKVRENELYGFDLRVFIRFVKEEQEWKCAGVDTKRTIEAEEKALNEQVEEARKHRLVQLANPELEGKTFDGKSVDLKTHRGRMVLIDFWGTWCGPCVAQIPGMKKIHSAFHQHGFDVIGVASDDSESLRDFFKDTPLPWANIVDEEGEIANQYGIEYFPTTFLIDQEGKHVATELHASDLVVELIKQLDLDSSQFVELKRELKEMENGSHGMHDDSDSDSDDGLLPVGFSAADVDDDGGVSHSELKKYLNDRLRDKRLPLKKVFKRIDKDHDQSISPQEFEGRYEAIEHFMGEEYFGGGGIPVDPGKDFVPVDGATGAINDAAVLGAVYHRFYDHIDANKEGWTTVSLAKVPASIAMSRLPQPPTLGTSSEDPESVSASETKPSTAQLIDATAIVGGAPLSSTRQGRSGGGGFFTSGAVIISEDGLALTNYHVVEPMKYGKIVAVMSNGKNHRVTELLAGDRRRDVALVRLEGTGFKPVRIATEIPKVGTNLVMLHHSENRFFTYDRGYVMRYALGGETPWMEISADYAVGGSGCGIFNERHELVGLVSSIMYGAGTEMSDEMMADSSAWTEDGAMGESQPFGPSGETGLLMVKRAVPLMAIHSLFSIEK